MKKLLLIASSILILTACESTQPQVENQRVVTDKGDYSPFLGRSLAEKQYNVRYDTTPEAVEEIRPTLPKYASGADLSNPVDEYDRRSGYRILGQQPAPPKIVTPPPVTKYVRNRDFVIYFGHDIDKLDADAIAAVQDAATELANYPTAKAYISGHTDTSGSSQYNIALSKRRAVNTTKMLLSTGIPPSRIIANYKGEHVTAVATGDGKEMRHNRRVEIRIR